MPLDLTKFRPRLNDLLLVDICQIWRDASGNTDDVVDPNTGSVIGPSADPFPLRVGGVTGGASGGTSVALTYPLDTEDDDVVLFAAALDQDRVVTWPGEMVLIAQAFNAGTTVAVAYRRIDGTEVGGNLTWVGAADAAFVAVNLRNVRPLVIPEDGAVSGNTTDTVNVSGLLAPWDEASLFATVIANDTSLVTVDDVPVPYTLTDTHQNGPRISVGIRTSFDPASPPSSWGLSASDNWVALEVALSGPESDIIQVYEGECGIKHVLRGTYMNESGQANVVGEYELKVPGGGIDPLPGDMVNLVTSTHDPNAVGKIFRVKERIHGSLAIFSKSRIELRGRGSDRP